MVGELKFIEVGCSLYDLLNKQRQAVIVEEWGQWRYCIWCALWFLEVILVIHKEVGFYGSWVYHGVLSLLGSCGGDK